MGNLNLYFPQWQGGGQKSLYIGAAAVRKGLDLKSRLTEVKLAPGDVLDTENDIIGYRQLVRQLETARNMIEESKPCSIFMLGGGCDVELAPVSYLNSYYDNDLSVLWLDAHGDLNTPASSKSKLFHGMPLRILLEDGLEEVDKLCFSKLVPEQVILLGARDLDLPEEEYIKEKNIKHITAEEIIWTDPMKWIGGLKNKYLPSH